MAHLKNCSSTLAAAACLAALLSAGLASADAPPADPPPLRLESRLATPTAPTLASPLRIGQTLRFAVWNDLGLWQSTPRSLPGLHKVQQPGIPARDPGTRAWYASAQGSLVRIEGDGRLTVVADNVQGLDVDVRAARKVAVSREPDDTIVLHDWGSSPASRKVLLAGSGFFGPRLSTDGSRILVKESRPTMGRIWVVSLDGTAIDMAEGYDAVWHPDGRHIVFVRVKHDGLTISEADFWVLDTVGRTERLLAHTPSVVEMQPAISPDGRWVAYADATGEGHVARLTLSAGGR